VPYGTAAVRVEPLAGLPVIRDLVVDAKPFWAEWASVKPWFVPAEHVPDGAMAPGSREAVLVDSALGCISCGVCHASCDIVQVGGDFLGPAALNRALALVADPRDGAADERLRVVGGRRGLDRCHYVQSCGSACPVGIDPSRSIAALRRLRIRSRG